MHEKLESTGEEYEHNLDGPALMKATSVSFNKQEKRFHIEDDFFAIVQLAEKEQKEFKKRTEIIEQRLISMEFGSPQE